LTIRYIVTLKNKYRRDKIKIIRKFKAKLLNIRFKSRQLNIFNETRPPQLSCFFFGGGGKLLKFKKKRLAKLIVLKRIPFWGSLVPVFGFKFQTDDGRNSITFWVIQSMININ